MRVQDLQQNYDDPAEVPAQPYRRRLWQAIQNEILAQPNIWDFDTLNIPVQLAYDPPYHLRVLERIDQLRADLYRADIDPAGIAVIVHPRDMYDLQTYIEPYQMPNGFPVNRHTGDMYVHGMRVIARTEDG